MLASKKRPLKLGVRCLQSLVENPQMPNTFCLEFGAYLGPYRERWYVENESFWYWDVFGFEKEKQVRIAHKEDHEFWKKLWEELYRAQIGKWNRNYHDPYILDGGYWEFEIEVAAARARCFRSGGCNAEPKELEQIKSWLEKITPGR
jgi:hypothetical protein